MGLKSKKHHKAESDDGDTAPGTAGVSRDADFSKLDEGSDGSSPVETPSSEPEAKKSSQKSEDTSKLTAELAEMKDKYLRSLAEFENFRKRALKERSELLKYQGEPILIDLLEVLDGFERALEHAEGDPAKLMEGIKLIHKLFVDTLGKWDVRADSGLGKEFDPARHRALGKAKVEGAKANTIIGELKKAYLYKDKLLRVGEVMVAEGETPPSEDKKDEGSQEDADDKEQVVH